METELVELNWDRDWETDIEYQLFYHKNHYLR